MHAGNQPKTLEIGQPERKFLFPNLIYTHPSNLRPTNEVRILLHSAHLHTETDCTDFACFPVVPRFAGYKEVSGSRA